MLARYKYNFYFCNVKSSVRYEAAAREQRFLYPIFIVNSNRKEWGSSNAPEVSARMNLTAPIAVSFV